MVEQFYGNLLLDDEICVNDDNPQSLMVGVAALCCYYQPLPQDSLYSFMQDRYIIPEIMQLATCDFLSAVEEYGEKNKVFSLTYASHDIT